MARQIFFPFAPNFTFMCDLLTVFSSSSTLDISRSLSIVDVFSFILISWQRRTAHKSHNNLTSAIKIRLNMRRLNGRKLLWKFSIFLCFYSDFKVIKVTQFNHCRKEILRDWIESLKLIKFAAVCVWGIEIYARVIGKFLHIEMHIFIILMPLFIIK